MRLSRGHRYVLALIAPAIEEWMEGGVNSHDTHCFWFGRGGGHFAFDEKSFLAIRIFSAALGGNDSSLENISRDEAMKHECFHE